MTRLPLIDNSHTPLVLIGGTLCTARLWGPLIERLNVSAVICLTLASADSAQESSRQLLPVLPPRFLLAGFSLGAIVALQMAADAPERLAGLTLTSVNPLADRPENAEPRRAAVQAAREQGHGEWLSGSLWNHYVAPTNRHNRALHDTLCLMAEETDSETFSRQTEIAISRRDNRAALRGLRCPVLILNGEHDPICTPEHHRLAAECAPKTTWVTLNLAGHFCVLESPDNAAAPLRQWIMESLICE
ncbi:alpha/beta hydrolase [Scandinavium sp. V105_16]|uniref:Alpha/beta hydrolase n=1 Tax=Scandinavium lactucae TaxID=3095028 RepID=A0AAJ2S4U6_9ENTR|nr:MULTISPECIES: alpha/beta hydrolase [unclassified Scandinavium]MDX6022134.1 alpha/beta hydrolase [Scandinavium sp. V105_16]MDX6034024.1 alpha/beta hydrolase [Scandinavium sp. V105_12]